ncbi:thymopoietin a isoform X8 [Conger conger]|uniref:thymopoietin a isoform X8 n=1 Tax=Conger conger TaxID=82655 RepID=UPI002A5986D8|nr:thymopoietin a isoform X8 [Conger conger]
MSEFLEDPSILTKDKLKSELVANNVSLPSGEHKKDVYVQLYLKTLTVRNKKKSPPDAFSSDEELPPPVVSNKSRSGRKATRKTDKPPADEVDAADLSDESLRDQLLKYGVSIGPIVASTRKLYERKLQKLMEQGPPEPAPPPAAPTKIDSNQNGNTDSDQYSDKEEEVRAVPEPEPEPQPEPVPVVEKPARSRGKTPPRTRRQDHNRVEERLAARDPVSVVGEKDLLKEMFPNQPSTPTGISATCRRPIRGAAGRPLTASDFRLDDTWRRSKHIETSTSYVENRSTVRAAAPLLSSSSSSSSSFSSSSVAAPSVGVARPRRSLPVWLQLLLLSGVAGFLFFVYQAMETNKINPFGGPKDLEGAGQ